MIPIKIQCGCGQRYAFDAEPVAGRMAAPVNCPICGTDGTAAANEIIARSSPPPPPIALVSAPVPEPAPSTGGVHLRISHAEAPAAEAATPRAANYIPPSAPHASQLGLVDRTQAEVEARAKVSWGDPPENVLKYLMIQGFKHDEASALVEVMYQERAVVVRATGFKKMVKGGLMIVAAGGGILYLLAIKLMLLKIMGGLVGICLWGAFIVIKGALMAALPKMESGDVAEQ